MIKIVKLTNNDITIQADHYFIINAVRQMLHHVDVFYPKVVSVKHNTHMPVEAIALQIKNIVVENLEYEKMLGVTGKIHTGIRQQENIVTTNGIKWSKEHKFHRYDNSALFMLQPGDYMDINFKLVSDTINTVGLFSIIDYEKRIANINSYGYISPLDILRKIIKKIELKYAYLLEAFVHKSRKIEIIKDTAKLCRIILKDETIMIGETIIGFIETQNREIVAVGTQKHFGIKDYTLTITHDKPCKLFEDALKGICKICKDIIIKINQYKK